MGLTITGGGIDERSSSRFDLMTTTITAMAMTAMAAAMTRKIIGDMPGRGAYRTPVARLIARVCAVGRLRVTLVGAR
jgi:hypothetical protein